jgi:hypothetical protein
LRNAHRVQKRPQNRKLTKSRRKCRRHIRKETGFKAGPRYSVAFFRRPDFEILPDGTVLNFTI